MKVEEVRTAIDVDENYETLAVATKKDGKWELDIFQMPVVEGSTQPKGADNK